MGIGVADFDDDGWPDLFVANDTTPAFLFMNNRNGTFTESAFERAVAFTERAEPVSGMGADARDVDDDGRPDVFETALANETFPLFRNTGGGQFEEATVRSGLAALARPRSGWGNGIYDLNNDGTKDLFVACADVMDREGEFRDRVPMANAVFVGLGDRPLRRRQPGRGRGVRAQGRPPWRRVRGPGRRRPRGRARDRARRAARALAQPLARGPPLAARRPRWAGRATATRSGRRSRSSPRRGTQHNHVTTAVGYGSASDRRVHFGLGREAVVKELTVTWPSGKTQTLKDVPADQVSGASP